jgi:hypothetical protein
MSLLFANFNATYFKKMKKNILILFTSIFIFSCHHEKEMSSINPVNWAKRGVDISTRDSLEYGKSYLSIYSQIYSSSEHKTHNLTAMASLRNTSDSDTIYLLKAAYFDTHGKPIRTYFNTPIYIAPMETTEIIIDESDIEGGTGSNFIIEWKIPKNCPEPLFEGIMNSTMGQQGLSFSTQAKRIE